MPPKHSYRLANALGRLFMVNVQIFSATHIFFDLDGTLTDSKPGIINGYMHSLKSLGLTADPKDLNAFIGPPIRDCFRNAYGFDEETVARAVESYRAYYREVGYRENRPYEGIPEMLRQLYEAGKTLVLATAKPDYFAEKIVRLFNLYGYFSFIGAAEMNGKRNSKADILRYAHAHVGAPDMAACLMVGDRSHDVEGAHAVGMACAGVLYGYGGQQELEEAGADFLIPTVRELTAFLQA